MEYPKLEDPYYIYYGKYQFSIDPIVFCKMSKKFTQLYKENPKSLTINSHPPTPSQTDVPISKEQQEFLKQSQEMMAAINNPSEAKFKEFLRKIPEASKIIIKPPKPAPQIPLSNTDKSKVEAFFDQNRQHFVTDEKLPEFQSSDPIRIPAGQRWLTTSSPPLIMGPKKKHALFATLEKNQARRWAGVPVRYRKHI